MAIREDEVCDPPGPPVEQGITDGAGVGRVAWYEHAGETSQLHTAAEVVGQLDLSE